MRTGICKSSHCSSVKRKSVKQLTRQWPFLLACFRDTIHILHRQWKREDNLTETLVNSVKSYRCTLGTLFSLCTSSQVPWFIYLHSRTCYSIYSKASPFCASQTTATRFPTGNRKGKVPCTRSLHQEAQHPKTVNNLGTGKLRIDTSAPPPPSPPPSPLPNSFCSAWFFPFLLLVLLA